MRWLSHTLISALVFSLCACGLLGGGGGDGTGGGAGGGTAAFTFSKGYAYVRKDDRNVYLTDQSDFQTSSKLTSVAGATSPALSADGTRVVFVNKVGQDTAILLVPTVGGTPSTLVASDTLHKNFKQPVFSPDGMTIAFAYEEGTSGAIGLVNADGSNFRKLIGGGSLGYGLPNFTSDGKHIIAAAGTTGAFEQIESIDTSSAVPTSITNTLGNTARAIINRLALSPDGTNVVFDGAVSSGVTRIFVMNLSTKMVTQVNDYMGEPGTNDTFPTWFASGTVAFSSDSGGNDNVYTVGTDGTGRHLQVAKAIEPWFGPQ